MNLFRKKPPVTPVPSPTFVADFSSGKIDPAVWTVSTWTAPGANATHKGSFSAQHAYVQNGTLCLKLTQTKTPAGTFESVGGELATLRQFSYGTFEWVARASSTADTPSGVGDPVSGSVTGCFVYKDQATTEIDFEVEGNERHELTQLTSWIHESKPNQHINVAPPLSGILPHEKFFTYKFKWTPGKIEFYRDGVLIGTHTTVVPTLTAPAMINHWGTNAADWGGLATAGTTRYMWVKSFKYTPL